MKKEGYPMKELLQKAIDAIYEYAIVVRMKLLCRKN